ncbi:Bax inhibitor-1/YccA family protein [Rhodovibrionaceae bacterium A322]
MAFGPDRTVVNRSQAAQAELDLGLRSYMLSVYNYMSLGVALTAIISFAFATSAELLQLAFSLKWVLFIGLLGLGFLAPRLMMTKSVGVAQICFWSYAALWGVLIAPMMAAYAQMDPMLIVRAFAITAGTFAGMSLLGYTTKKNLSGLGGFFMMATIGILIAMLINVFFVQSTGMSLIVSIGVVLLFSAMTAYETQMIKSMYAENEGGDTLARKAIFGAFMLYGSFITLFIHILSILGIMRE